ncbi:MAG: adenylyl-sulfate kinase [Elusimicrobiales bacterium]
MTDTEIRIAIAGHVDHGKSTLVGRLLSDTGQVAEDRKAKVEKICRRTGRPFEFAFLLDAFEEERSQGVTIDYTEIRWRFGRRRFLLIDTPGHREFSKNMATGASRADAAVLLLDAAEGLREQFRRHSRILAMLGIRKIIVAVNKMDLVAYDKRRFSVISSEARSFLGGLGLRPNAVIPLCSISGENLLRPAPAMPWYRGRPLARELLRFQHGKKDGPGPLRFSIQDVYKFDDKRIYAGRVESGTVKKGMKITFLPSGRTTCVRDIETWPGPGAETAGRGECAGLTLKDPLFLERGEIGVARPARGRGLPPFVSNLTRANIFWMGDRPLSPGTACKFRLTTQETACRLVSVENVIDPATFEKTDANEGSIAANNLGEVTLKLDTPLVFDEFAKIAGTGRFVLAEHGRVCGGGIILANAGREPLSGVGNGREPSSEKSGVAAAAREKRNGHPGFTVWFTGLSGSGKSTLARALEKKLFESGAQAYVLDGDELRRGINRDLGFSSADREENIRRAGEIAGLFAGAGMAVITAFISPFGSGRAAARAVSDRGRFVEAYLACPLEICARRDPKGLYKKARLGAIRDFTGIHSPYEVPSRPELTLRTDKMSVEESVEKIVKFLKSRRLLP